MVTTVATSSEPLPERDHLIGEMSVLVDRWAASGLVSGDQAERMRADLAGLTNQERHRVPPRAGSVVVEALGYLGGVIVVVGALSVAAQYWEELSTAWRLGGVLATAVLLLIAGAVAPVARGAAAVRLRSVLWLASTAAASGALALLADDVLDLGVRDALLVIGAGTATYATALWLVNRNLLQQLAMVAAAAMTAAAVVNKADVGPDAPGLGVWGVGVVWALLGWGGFLGPRRVVLALGTALAIFGGMLAGGSDAGLVLTLVTIAVAVAASILLQDLVLLGVATLGALVNIPAAMTRWFPDSLVGAWALVVAGLVLVTAAVWIARSGRGGER
jgi:hypothetical protein